MARYALGPRGEPTSITLLIIHTDYANGHSIKLAPNHCAHRLWHLSDLMKEASSCSRWWLTQRLTADQGSEDKRQGITQSEMGYL